MERRIKIFWIVFISLVLIVAGVLFINRKHFVKGKTPLETDKAISSAKVLYRRTISQNIDISTGPCLSNDLLHGWVADLVHNPRIPADDLQNNQCPAFLEGRASHFVELDLNGNLIRVE